MTINMIKNHENFSFIIEDQYAEKFSSNMSKNLRRFVNHITVEPVLFFYWSVYIITDATHTNLLLQKACRFNATSEPDLNTQCDDEKRGIIFATEMSSTYRFIMTLLGLVFAIFAVSWSDTAGRRRRPVIFLPAIGLMFQALFGCLHSYFWTWIPVTASILHNLPEMMTGGISSMILGTQMYICDVSSTQSRTMRMGFLLAVRTLADLVGYGGSGFILRSVGFFYTFLLCFGVAVFNLLVIMVFVKDISVPIDDDGKSGFSKIFDSLKITENFRVVFDKSLGKKRVVVAMLLSIYSLVFFTSQGEKNVLYLFLRYKFHWNEREYSAYVFYRLVGVIFGNIFTSIVLSKRLQMHDGIIGIIAGIFDTVAASGYLIASQNWQLFVVPIFDVFHGTALTVCICFLSKFYESDKIGRVNSMLGIFALLIPACHPVYNGIFQYFLDIFPSAFFLLSISLDIIIVLLYGASYLITQKLLQQKPVIKEEKILIN